MEDICEDVEELMELMSHHAMQSVVIRSFVYERRSDMDISEGSVFVRGPIGCVSLGGGGGEGLCQCLETCS